jgi:ATP-dependent DNA ligase
LLAKAFGLILTARQDATGDERSGDGDIVYQHACKLGCEGIVSKRLGSTDRSGRSKHWLQAKNPAAPAVRREAEEEWR